MYVPLGQCTKISAPKKPDASEDIGLRSYTMKQVDLDRIVRKSLDPTCRILV